MRYYIVILFSFLGFLNIHAQDLFDQNVQYNIIVESPQDSVIEVSYEVYFTDQEDNQQFFITDSQDSFLLILLNDIAKLDQDKNKLLLYIHGMWGGRRQNFKRAYKLMRVGYLDDPNSDIGRMISLKWPGNKMEYRRNKRTLYSIDKQIAELTFDFVRKLQTIDWLSSRFKTHVDVIAHSLGNELLKEIIKEVPEEEMVHPFFDEIILAASDLEIDIFETDPQLKNIAKVANRTHIYYSPRDITLGISKNLNKKSRLGLDGPSAKTDVPKNIHFVNVANIKDDANMGDKMNGHSYYRSSPLSRRDMLFVLKSEKLSNIENRVPIDSLQNAYLLLAPDKDAID